MSRCCLANLHTSAVQDARPPPEVLRAAQREFKRLQRGSEQHPGAPAGRGLHGCFGSVRLLRFWPCFPGAYSACLLPQRF